MATLDQDDLDAIEALIAATKVTLADGIHGGPSTEIQVFPSGYPVEKAVWLYDLQNGAGIAEDVVVGLTRNRQLVSVGYWDGTETDPLTIAFSSTIPADAALEVVAYHPDTLVSTVLYRNDGGAGWVKSVEFDRVLNRKEVLRVTAYPGISGDPIPAGVLSITINDSSVGQGDTIPVRLPSVAGGSRDFYFNPSGAPYMNDGGVASVMAPPTDYPVSVTYRTTTPVGAIDTITWQSGMVWTYQYTGSQLVQVVRS